MLKALQDAGHVKSAARLLGVHHGLFYARAKTDSAVAEAMANISKTSFQLVDMSGQSINGWNVLKRGTNYQGSATWLIEHSCGHRRYAIGSQLRAGKVSCPNCRGGR